MLPRGIGQRGKIDMGSEVRLAGMCKRVIICVPEQCLQRVADRWFFIAIVDKQADTAIACDALGDGLHQRAACWSKLDDCAFRRVGGVWRQYRRVGCPGAGHEN